MSTIESKLAALTEEQQAALAELLSLVVTPEAPASTPEKGLHRNAAGRLVDAKGRFVKEGEVKAAPKKATTKKATTAKKAEAKEGVLLRKATRKAFLKAAVKVDDFVAAAEAEFPDVDPRSLSTKQAATVAVKHDVVPKGYVVGEGYRELVS